MSELISHSLTHTGNVRPHNEDAILAKTERGLWAVADGMGGHTAGDFASQYLISHLQQYSEQYEGKELSDKIFQCLSEAHQFIYQHSRCLPEQPIIGTTIVVLVMESDHYHCYWSGDSRCYLMRDNALSLITTDHTEAEQLMQTSEFMAAMSPKEQLRAENTLVHAIGIDNSLPYIDYVTDYIYEGDRFLLCSDGINKVYDDSELAYRMQGNDVCDINVRFIDDAVNGHAPDNLSSIVIGIE